MEEYNEKPDVIKQPGVMLQSSDVFRIIYGVRKAEEFKAVQQDQEVRNIFISLVSIPTYCMVAEKFR